MNECFKQLSKVKERKVAVKGRRASCSLWLEMEALQNSVCARVGACVCVCVVLFVHDHKCD